MADLIKQRKLWTGRINCCLGGMCVLSCIFIGVTGLLINSVVESYTKFPDVCDAVVENFTDLTIVPEITSLGLGVVSVTDSQLRHSLTDDFWSIVTPVVLTFDPARPPNYVGVTAESVGRNHVQIVASYCDSAINWVFTGIGPDVDDGITRYVIAQLPELKDPTICSLSISQKNSLPFDGMGISEIVLAYPCTPSGVVADVLRDMGRDIVIRQLTIYASITGVVLLFTVSLAVYRSRRLKRIRLTLDKTGVDSK